MLCLYLYVKLQISLVHLSGNHTLYHMHRHQLVALICWTEDIVCITFLNFYIEEPEKKKEESRNRTPLTPKNGSNVV